MNKSLINNNLIVNSKEELVLLHLEEQGGVKYTKYDLSYRPIETSMLYKKDVFRYSVLIDSNDIIHLIALMKSGELNYSIYKDTNWSNAVIAKFDFKSNIYNDIDILLKDKNVNIIYNYANLINTKLWTIQHVIGIKQDWDKYNVVSFMADKSSAQFYIDKDSLGTIHLLYSSIEGDNYQIYHTFCNLFSKRWNPTPQKLSSPNTNNLFPYLFIDTKDNLHGLWLDKTNKKNVLKYCRLTSKRNERYTWNQIKIPYISDCNNVPIIIEEKNVLKIVYLKNNSIGFLYSLDNGSTWYKGDVLEIDPSTINLVKVSTNLFKSKDIKINHAYCTIGQPLNFYFLSSFIPVGSTPSYTNTNNVVDESDKPVDQVYEVKNEEKIILKINRLSETQEEIKAILYKTLDSQNKIEEKIEIILKILNTDKGSIFDKLFRSPK